MAKTQFIAAALFLATTLIVIGCASSPGKARAQRGAIPSRETGLLEQLDAARAQMRADAETMRLLKKQIEELSDWIDRFTTDPRETLTQLYVQNKALKKKVRLQQSWLDKYRGLLGFEDHSGPQGSDGVVKSVKGELVVLSVGSDDGVRNGDVYQVRRGSSYVGQLTVTKVYRDQSVGKFDNAFRGPGAPPQAGDVAESKNY